MRTYPELSDWHLHSHFSSDSTETPENIIKNAINMQLKSICFTEHNDYDYPLEDGNVVFALDYDKYTDELLELKEHYKNDIFIGIGVEQGLLSSAKDKINNYDPTGRLDFIIGSSHLVYGNDPYYPEFWDNVSVKDAISRYYEAITDCIKTCDNFDVYGHLDYIVRYAPDQDNDYNWKDYYDYFDTILRLLIDKGKGIEINTAGLKYGLKNPNPCLDIVKMYHSLGGEIITTVSDAHKACHIAYSYEIITDMLKNTGFNYYTIFKERKPEFVSI